MGKRLAHCALVMGTAISAGPAWGQGSSSPAPGEATPTPPPTASQVAPCCRLAAGTPVEVELTQMVSSRVAVEGDRFTFRLVQDIQVDGRTVVAAGAQGDGEVIDVAAGGIAGRPGKLVLVARGLDAGALRIPLRGFHLGSSGRDSSKVAIGLSATPYVGILALAVPGGNVEYPAGVHVLAKVAADTVIPPLGPPAAAGPPDASPSRPASIPPPVTPAAASPPATEQQGGTP
jgi:hypothetical protein